MILTLTVMRMRGPRQFEDEHAAQVQQEAVDCA